MRSSFGNAGSPYTVVVESEKRDAREKTTHYTYRQATGDTRIWGSPYNLFFEPTKSAQEGEALTSKAWIVNGELVEEEVEKFVRARLALDSLTQ